MPPVARLGPALLVLALASCAALDPLLPTPEAPLTTQQILGRCYADLRDGRLVVYRPPAGGGIVGKAACEQYADDVLNEQERLAAAAVYRARERDPFLIPAPPPLPPPLAPLPAVSGPSPAGPAVGEAVPEPHQRPGPVPGFTPYRFPRERAPERELSLEEWLRAHPELRQPGAAAPQP